jgi:hypothetical protein
VITATWSCNEKNSAISFSHGLVVSGLPTCRQAAASTVFRISWLGAWSLAAVVAALAWIWLNPRAFGPAADDSAWISKGVLGERLWAHRDQQPVPERHRIVPHVLNLAQLTQIFRGMPM